MSDCRYLMLKLGNLLLEHVYREQNKLAHALARMNTITSMQLFWESLESVNDILRADTNRDLSCRRVKIDTSDQILFTSTNPNCQIVNTSARCAVTTVGACTVGLPTYNFPGVTLVGIGKETGDRHPKIGQGALIGASVTILRNIKVGEGAMVGANSLVMKDVPLHSMVIGIPAKVVGYIDDQNPSLNMKHDVSKEFFQKVAISCKEARSNVSINVECTRDTCSSVSYLEIATDFLEVINSLDSLTQTNNNLTPSCRDRLLKLGSPMMLHKSRRHNSVADKLAKHG
ncbi:putative serine acetyltransferase 2 [Capsicum chinense]|nr:putative serine acetyltransferase 2 [Capsicum chinense]